MANGPYYGGGMYIAPYAKLDDGLLDVVIVSDVEKSELLNIWLMSYRGKHIQHPKLQVERVSSLTIRSAERVLVETDGECLGECPATFSILPCGLAIVT
jgi:diacylglycerol kinase family enzyme